LAKAILLSGAGIASTAVMMVRPSPDGRWLQKDEVMVN